MNRNKYGNAHQYQGLFLPFLREISYSFSPHCESFRKWHVSKNAKDLQESATLPNRLSVSSTMGISPVGLEYGGQSWVLVRQSWIPQAFR